MIFDERMEAFLASMDTGNSDFLNALEKQAKEDFVPVIRRETQCALRVFLALVKPHKILEVGTAVGFSSILMCENSDAHITTIENYEKRIPLAEKNFEAAGVKSRVTLLFGDAREILPALTGSYDFIFMDAAKGQYIYFLPEILRLLADGGLLLTDNVLQGGDILESHYAVERRNRTIYKRMREYLYELTHREELSTMILPIGDGLAVTVKKPAAAVNTGGNENETP
ncbi:MAG TPA: O-methyltransferase [Lachnospiraceae bacterium]|nr:O-methyltransferase [Lachnospiraceae bacterium]